MAFTCARQEARLQYSGNDEKLACRTRFEKLPVVRPVAFCCMSATPRCAFAGKALLAAGGAGLHLGVVPCANQHVKVGILGRRVQFAGQELQRLSHMQAMQVHHSPPPHLQNALHQSARIR